MEEKPEYDFDRICRTCKCESTIVRSVFETFENVDSTTHIHEMLMACAAVQVCTVKIKGEMKTNNTV